jgi:hypothetical protein
MYRIGGGPGYIYSASHDENGRGSLRLSFVTPLAKDATRLARPFDPGVELRFGFQSAFPPFCQLGHRDIRVPGHKIQRLSAQQSRHYGHLALNGKTLRPICIDARGSAFASFDRALRYPIGLPPFIDRHLYTSGCGSIYHSRMSHLTVPHPSRAPTGLRFASCCQATGQSIGGPQTRR